MYDWLLTIVYNLLLNSFCLLLFLQPIAEGQAGDALGVAYEGLAHFCLLDLPDAHEGVRADRDAEDWVHGEVAVPDPAAVPCQDLELLVLLVFLVVLPDLARTVRTACC